MIGAVLLAALVAVRPEPLALAVAADTERRSMVVDGRRRSYLVHAPSRRDGRLPVVLVFHGGGSTALAMERESGFSALADREGFIAVYPEGVGQSWNDGRGEGSTPAVREGVDDARFVARLLDALEAEYPVDRGRVYATGISNGAILSHLLAVTLSDRIVAIAPVAGGLAQPLAHGFRPGRPVSVLVLQGTHDPLVPYRGGGVGVRRARRGAIVGTDAAVGLWRRHNETQEIGQERLLPDRAPGDGCRVEVRRWNAGRDSTEVVLYRLEGAGHTWPGGTQYLPRRVIGGVCRDLDGAEVIWAFFRRHARR
jgi:polyhydroxybutyrate depolymerase